MRIKIILREDGTSTVTYPAESGLKVSVEVSNFGAGVSINVDADYPRVVTCDKGLKLLERMVSMIGMCVVSGDRPGIEQWQSDARQYIESLSGPLVRLKEEK